MWHSIHVAVTPIIRFLKGGELRHYIVSDEKKLAYLIVPKTGCSSVKSTFANGSESSDLPVHEQIGRRLHVDMLTPAQKKYHTFTFVRNPFDRLVSCYVHKIQGSSHRLRGWYGPFAHIKEEETFESFVDKICRVPDILADWHFQSQYSLIYDKKGRPLFDELCHFETIQEDFEPIRAKYNLQSLPHVHNTQKGDWKKFYTKVTAKKVYKKYKKDIEVFEYDKAYHELMDYLESLST